MSVRAGLPVRAMPFLGAAHPSDHAIPPPFTAGGSLCVLCARLSFTAGGPEATTCAGRSKMFFHPSFPAVIFGPRPGTVLLNIRVASSPCPLWPAMEVRAGGAALTGRRTGA